MANVLVIKNGATTYNFTSIEVDSVKIETHEVQDLQILQNRKPIIYGISNEWNEITVLIRPDPDIADIWTVANTLKSVTNIMSLKCYYELSGDLAESSNVRINPNITLHYHSGQKDGEKLIKLVFYESAEYLIAATSHFGAGV